MAVVYGGRSSEHSISCVSAGSILRHLDPRRFDVVPVGITRAGVWLLTGADLLEGLATKDLGQALLLPRVMLREGDDVFLDDIRLETLRQRLPVPIRLLAGAADLVACCLGSQGEDA